MVKKKPPVRKAKSGPYKVKAKKGLTRKAVLSATGGKKRNPRKRGPPGNTRPSSAGKPGRTGKNVKRTPKRTGTKPGKPFKKHAGVKPARRVQRPVRKPAKSAGRPAVRHARAVKKAPQAARRETPRPPEKSTAKRPKKLLIPKGGILCEPVSKREWELKTHVWKDKPFFVVRHRLFFRMPVNLGKVVRDAMKEIKKRKYRSASPPIMLEQDIGRFRSKLMIAIRNTKKYGPNMEYLSGTFISKVHQGPVNQIEMTVAELSKQAEKIRGVRPTEVYFWHTNCLKCAGKESNQQAVIFIRLK